MECGARWFIDSIAVDANHSGFSEVELQNWLELKPGVPFEKESLLSAQENLAFELQSRGYATFNTTHVRFLVDTTGRNASGGLVLSLRCEPWEPAQSLELSFDDTLKTPGYNHPLVHFGKITWNGGHRGAELRPGGVRQEVWGHVSSTQPEAKYDPLAVQSNYERLSRLNSMGRVQLSSNLRFDSSTALVAERVVSGVVMDIDFSLIPKPTHDVGFELDMIRNDARYGPSLVYVASSKSERLGSSKRLGSRLWLCFCKSLRFIEPSQYLEQCGMDLHSLEDVPNRDSAIAIGDFSTINRTIHDH